MKTKKLFTAACLVLPMLAACGGGGGSPLPTGAPGSPTAAYDLTGVSLRVGATNVSLAGSPFPSALPLSWTAVRQGGLPAYFVTAHAVAAGSGQTASLDDSNRLLSRNCGPAVSGCDASGQITCTYANVNGNARLNCDAVNARSLPPGSYDIVLRACFHNERLDQVCRGEHGPGRDRYVQRVTFN